MQSSLNLMKFSEHQKQQKLLIKLILELIKTGAYRKIHTNKKQHLFLASIDCKIHQTNANVYK